MKPIDPRQVLLVAEAIRNYLQSRPGAVDTADGIADWWLERRPGMDLRLLVRRALERLENEGCVERVPSNAGRPMYRSTGPS